MTAGSDPWPVELRGVTESVVTTLGPNGRWNVAALGIHASGNEGGPVTARTWGRTRTWRNFAERGSGYVQFVDDPVDFVEAAVTVREEEDAILQCACAWVEVDVQRREEGADDGTQWVDWELHPADARVVRERVPTINRGFNAVVEATVAASRLDVPAYETQALLDHLSHLEGIVETCGGRREREAFAVLGDHVDADW